jgi:hypothetical protein
MQRFGRNTKRLAAALLALVLPLCSCRPYHMYAGDPLPASEISSIRHSRRVVLIAIDGGDTGLSNQFRLLPGRHTVSVQIYSIKLLTSAYPERRAKEVRTPECICELQLDTWAGATYLVDSRELSGNVWIAFVQSIHAGDQVEPDPENLPHCTCAA